MQIKCNDPLNLFTHQVEQYPPVQDIIQGIRTANHNITNNLKSLENFIESEKSKEDTISDWANDLQPCTCTNTNKKAVFLYVRSQNFMREYLNLPQPNTIKILLGTIDSPGELHTNMKIPITPFLSNWPIKKL